MHILSFAHYVESRNFNHRDIHCKNVDFKFKFQVFWRFLKAWVVKDFIWLIRFIIFSRKTIHFTILSRKNLDNDSKVLLYCRILEILEILSLWLIRKTFFCEKNVFFLFFFVSFLILSKCEQKSKMNLMKSFFS